MSKICLQATEFRRINGSTFGFCMYDEHAQAYDNLSESLIEDDIELLKYAYQGHSGVNDEISGMFNHIKESKCGIEINGEWYDWDDIVEHLGLKIEEIPE